MEESVVAFVFSIIRQFITPLLIVFALRYGPSLWNWLRTGHTGGAQQLAVQLRGKKPTTQYDTVVTATLLTTGVLLVAAAFYWPFDNVYQRLGLLPSSPSYAFKRACEEQLPDTRDALICNKLTGNSDKYIYMIHGPNALECEWCRENQDYFFYAFPPVLWQYTAFLGLVGACAGNWRRTGSKWAVLLVSVCLLTMEAGIRLTEVPSNIGLFAEDDTQSIAITRIRWILFALLLLAFYARGRGDAWTQEDIFKNLIETSLETRGRYVASEAIDSVLYVDNALRQKYYALRETQAQTVRTIHKNPDIKAVRRNLVIKHNMEALRSQAAQWRQRIYGLAGFSEPGTVAIPEESVHPWDEYE
ncbi:hypothetical protein HDV03_001693 [Kappamyces sp. JEL0829]|nr:hypothetical protein HDV03_001693 [Kappamyces sp. JEL0829]